MLITILRALLVAFSIYGYLQFFRKRIKLEFCIAFVFAGIGGAMFIFGIFGLLMVGAILVLAGGIACAVISIIKKDRFRDVISVGTVFFICLCIFFAIILFGCKFTHFDSFSHWGIVAKTLIAENHFPNALDINVEYQSYPVGSAAFIYFFAKIIGVTSEWFQAFIQAMLMSSMAICLCAFAKKGIHYIICILLPIVLFCSCVPLNDLLVDTLLPLIGLAAFALWFYYLKDHGTYWLYLIPFLVFLMSVKNSGIIFCIIILGCCLYSYFSSRNKKNVPSVYNTDSQTNIASEMPKSQEQSDCKVKFYKWLILLACPVVTLVLWQIRVKIIFADGLSTKHSMSISNLLSTWHAKGWSERFDILKNFFDTVFSFSNTAVFLLILVIVLGVSCFVVRKIFKSKHIKKIENDFVNPVKGLLILLIVVLGSYIIYQIGNAAMYLFSMPSYEASILAGYWRYHQTIMIFCFGVLGIVPMLDFSKLVNEIANSENQHDLGKIVNADRHEKNNSSSRIVTVITVVATCLVLAASYFALKPDFSLYSKQNLQSTNGSLRTQYDQFISENEIPSGSSYLVIVPDDFTDTYRLYMYYMTRYLLNPTACESRWSSELLENPEIADSYEYIINFDDVSD